MAKSQKQFPPTRWTYVECAARPDDPEQEKALGDLLATYLPVLKRYLVAQFHFDEPHAEDLLQGFVLEKVLKGGVLARAERQRGRFRTFLLNVLTNFVVSEQRRARALKRAPAQGSVSLDELSETAPEVALAPAAAQFDLAFARQVIAEALRRMESQCEVAARPDIWGVFVGRLLNPIFDQAAPANYEVLVERFGFQSPGHASNVLITAKRMFARVLRSVVAEYVAGEGEIDTELEELQAILANPTSAG